MTSIKKSLELSQEDEVISYILISYFINQTEKVDDFLNFILFFYPNADIEQFDKLDDQKRDYIFKKLGNLLLLMIQLTGDSYLNKIQKENLSKVINLAKALVFDFIIQYIMQTLCKNRIAH